MTSGYRTGWLRLLAAAVVVALVSPLAMAEERSAKEPEAAPETVEMFAAIKADQIGVRLIPKDSTECRVLIENKTDKPLSVKLPPAFAGVPVLAQPGMGGIGGARGAGGFGGVGGRGFGGGGFGGGGQTMGGGMGGMGGMGMGGMGGMGMGGMGGMGGGMFNVPPEKVGKLTVATVCLEHGKREPRAAMQYEIQPIEQYTDKGEVQELCRMLGTGAVPQRVAQAAAWNLANDMSWQELAAKQLRFANGRRAPYFSAAEIQAGMQVAAAAIQMAKQRESTPQTDSLSQQ
jgi:hypothetical protein